MTDTYMKIMKKLEYSLLALILSEQDCIRIIAPVLEIVQGELEYAIRFQGRFYMEQGNH